MLTSLTNLDMSGINITAQLPSELGLLTKLVILDVGTSKVKGSIPESLGNLGLLTRLDLGSNSLSGTIPASITNMRSLQSLQLDNNQLVGSVPTAMSALTKLTLLYLQNNLLTGPLPFLMGAANVDVTVTNNYFTGNANVSSCKFNGKWSGDNNCFSSTPACPSTTRSPVSSCQTFCQAYLGSSTNPAPCAGTALCQPLPSSFTTVLPSYACSQVDPMTEGGALYAQWVAWGRPTSLTWTGTNPCFGWNGVTCVNGSVTSLSIFFGGYLQGPLVQQLSVLTALSQLSIVRYKINDTLPAVWGTLTRLTSVALSRNQLTGPIPESWSSLTGLRYLDLGYNKLSGFIPSWLFSLPLLTDLLLGSNKLVGVLPPVNLPRVERLLLGDNYLSGSLVLSVPKITRASFANNYFIGTPAVTGCANRTQISLDNNCFTSFGACAAGSFRQASSCALFCQAGVGDTPYPPCNGLGTCVLSQGTYYPFQCANCAEGTVSSMVAQVPDQNCNPVSEAGMLQVQAQVWGVPSLISQWSGVDPCVPTPWPNITCSTDGSVASLRVDAAQAAAPLSSLLGFLTGLTALQVTNSGVTGSLPPTLSLLQRLALLNLSGNKLSGGIPDNFSNLTALTSLNLGRNSLSGPIPPWAGALQRLITLDLSSNAINGSFPLGMSNLTSLQYLYLDMNQLIGTIDPSISIPRLRYGGFTYNYFTGLLPAYLSPIYAQLRFDWNYFTESTVQCSNESISAWMNCFTTTSPCYTATQNSSRCLQFCRTGSGSAPAPPCSGLGTCDPVGPSGSSFQCICNDTIGAKLDVNLEYPSCSLNPLGDLILRCQQSPGSPTKGLNCSRGLISVNLSSSAFNNLGFPLPPSLFTSSVAFINVSYSNVGGSMPTVVRRARSLVSLLAAGNSIAGQLPAALVRLTNLSLLDLSENGLTGTVPWDLRRMPLLRSLNLRNNSLVGSLTTFSNMSFLDVSNNFLGGSLVDVRTTGATNARVYLESNYFSGTSPMSPYPCGFLNAIRCCKPDPGNQDVRQDMNCFTSNKCHNARVASACQSFCGASLSGGPCGGHGVCGPSPYSGTAYQCVTCYPGYYPDPATRNQTCIPNPLESLLEQCFDDPGDPPTGVACGPGNEVYSVDLSSMPLDNKALPIPDTVFHPELSRLFLDSNSSFGGTMPMALGLSTSLTYLNISGSAISGSLPNVFSSMPLLEVLALSGSALSGPIPDSISTCTALSVLDLTANQFTGPIPSWLSTLVGLTSLRLGRNVLSGSIPDLNLPSLAFLELNANTLEGTLPGSLGALTSLRTLLLASNKLWGPLPESLSQLALLQVLDLGVNSFNSTIPSFLSSLSRLTYINLGTNSFYGTIPAFLGTLSQIYLDNNQFSGALPASFSGLAPPSSSWVNNFLTGSFCGNTSRNASLQSKSNCFSGTGTASLCGDQKADAVCSQFCNTTSPVGPCGGRGVCALLGTNGVPSCVCSGLYSADPFDPSSCVLTSSLNLSSIPTSSGPTAQGVDLGSVPYAKLNKWSRYLSLNSYISNGVPGWLVLSSSAWLAPPGIFLSYTGSAATSNVITWPYVRDQGFCESCWVTASLDALGSSMTLASSSTGGDATRLSAEQLLRCNSSGGYCKGDFPTNAFDYATSASIAADSDTAPACDDLEVTSASPPAVMYEGVQFRGWFGLLLTLQRQPALVILDGSSQAFQQPTCYIRNFIFSDPGCNTGVLGHSVLVVGYDLGALQPYWVIRNSWGANWCTNGYMRIAIQGGQGTCSMNSLPAYYPVPAPPLGDPCYSGSTVPQGVPSAFATPSLNPCGGGVCSPQPDWGPYSYTCNCNGLGSFIAVNNSIPISLPDAGTGITQACVPVDACAFTSYNPCDVGTCINDGKGGYYCLCPPGYFETKLDGKPLCTFSMTGVPDSATFTVQQPISCTQVAQSFGLSAAALVSQNPLAPLSCTFNTILPVGLTLNVANPQYSCSIGYSAAATDTTCQKIADRARPRTAGVAGLSQADLAILNPSLNCSNIPKGQLVCLRGGSWKPSSPCTKLVALSAGDTCQLLTDRYFPTDPVLFFGHNPGIDCDILANPSGGGVASGSAGDTVCLGSVPVGASPCKPGQLSTKFGNGDNCGNMLKRTGFPTAYAMINFNNDRFSCPGFVQGTTVCYPP